MTIPIGIIGCGVIGEKHLQAAAGDPLIRLEAVTDQDQAKALNVASRFGVKKVYTDAEELLGDPEVQGVVLAIPTAGRTRLALRALEKGKHVLLEKPAAMNSSEIMELLRAQGDRQVACCSSRFRFLEAADFITGFIANGALGTIRSVRCRIIKPAGMLPEVQPPVWRLNKGINGGGILVNWGCYDLDYLLGITGWTLRPQTVVARTWPVPEVYRKHVAPGSDAETHYLAVMICKDGAVLSLERSEYSAAAPEESWQIIGEKGSLRLTMVDREEKTVEFDEADCMQGVVSRTIWRGKETNSLIWDGPVRDFAKAIAGKGRPKTNLLQSLEIQRITDAIYESAAQGTAVSIDDSPNVK